jgi:hypothetical protein
VIYILAKMNPQATSPTFPLFGELPTEIRLKIWKIAAREPRLVNIKCQKEAYMAGTRKRFFAKSFTTTNPVPPLLHACHESRAETISEYQLSFATSHTPASIYINFDRDTPRLASVALAYLGPEELSKIRFLSIKVIDYPYFAHFNMGILRDMESLESLELLAHQGQEASRGRGVARTLTDDFNEERERYPEGKVLLVRIVSGDTGEEIAARNEDGSWNKEFPVYMDDPAPGGLIRRTGLSETNSLTWTGI